MYTNTGKTKFKKKLRMNNLRILQTSINTSNNSSSECTATQKIPFEEIKVPYVKHENLGSGQRGTEESTRDHPEFSFEKNRLKALGEECISKYQIQGPITEIDKEDPRAIRVSLYNEARLAQELNSVNRWSLALKTLSVIATIWSVLQVVLSMIFTFIMALYQQINIFQNTLPMIINIIESVWMISISLRGGTISGITDPEAPHISRYIKLSIITILALIIQFVIMPCVQSIPKSINSLGNMGLEGDTEESAENRGEAFMGLGYLVVWISTLVNVAGCALGLWFTFLLRKYMRLRDIHTLEQKTLPLGYQVYAKLSPQDQSVSVPYNV